MVTQLAPRLISLTLTFASFAIFQSSHQYPNKMQLFIRPRSSLSPSPVNPTARFRSHPPSSICSTLVPEPVQASTPNKTLLHPLIHQGNQTEADNQQAPPTKAVPGIFKFWFPVLGPFVEARRAFSRAWCPRVCKVCGYRLRISERTCLNIFPFPASAPHSTPDDDALILP